MRYSRGVSRRGRGYINQCFPGLVSSPHIDSVYSLFGRVVPNRSQGSRKTFDSHVTLDKGKFCPGHTDTQKSVSYSKKIVLNIDSSAADTARSMAREGGRGVFLIFAPTTYLR